MPWLKATCKREQVVADHNDPNAVNSIFSDIDVSAADLYDIFGFPSDDASGDEKVVIALTFAAVPHTGILDSDMLYRILIAPDRRFVRSAGEDASLEGFLAYLETVKNRYLSVLKPSEVRVTVDRDNQAHIRFINFPGGSFSAAVATNQSVTLQSPNRQPIKVFIGGRDDAFFNDLPGFFRSINYAPQFYHVPHTMPDEPLWIEHPHVLLDAFMLDDELKKYKLVDTDGQAFADAALSEREDNRQLGANNFWLAPHFIKRLGHLGWGFGPSITALGLASAFDHDDSPVSVHRTYTHVVDAFPRVKKILFQELNMPDGSWNRKGLQIPLRRPVDVFIPNVNSIDMDTTGTWPFGRRLEDQVATRFLSSFLVMSASLNGKRYHVELLNDPALWNSAPIAPQTPPNPLKNDKEFLPDFPYLAEPW